MRDSNAGLGPDAMLGDKPVRAAGERAGRPSGIRRIHLRRIRRIDVVRVCRSESRNRVRNWLGARASKVIPRAWFGGHAASRPAGASTRLHQNDCLNPNCHVPDTTVAIRSSRCE